MRYLGLGAVLFAVGAVLRWAVSVPNAHVNLGVIGVILMVVGVIVVVLGLAFDSPWPRQRTRREEFRDDQGRGYQRVIRDDDSRPL